MHPEKRRILFFLLLLGGALLIGDRILGWALRSIQDRIRTGDHGGKIESVLQGRVRPYLLLLGSSRMEYSVDPDRFPYPTYNLGHAGYEIYWAEGVLGLLADAKRLPPAVLLELDRETFLADTADAYTLRDRRFLRTLWRRGDWVDRHSQQWPFLDRLKFLLAAYPFNGEAFYLLQDWLRPEGDSNGFTAFAVEPGDSERVIHLERAAEVKLNRSHPAGVGTVSRTQLQMLSDLAANLKKRGVFLAAFSAPEYRDDGSLEFVARDLDSVLAQQSFPYLDFYGLSKWQDDADLYHDPGHVNARGAQRVTAILVAWMAPHLPGK